MFRELDLKRIISLVCLLALTIFNTTLYPTITSNSRNDPYPVFTSMDPHYFLYTYERDRLKGVESIKEKPEWFGVSISPFAQNATCARSRFQFSCQNLTEQFNTPTAPLPNTNIEIGNLGGRWGMIGLLFGPLPEGRVLPPALIEARNALFPNVTPGTPIDDTLAIDKKEQFGFFSVPVNYRKRGVRFEVEALIACDFGISLDIGVADICQTGTFNNLTCQATNFCTNTPFTDPNNDNLTINKVDQYLMFNLQTIACQIGLDLENFHKVSCEDLRAGLFWRHAYPMNMNRKGIGCFEEFLLIPFVYLQGSVPLGQDRCWNQPFALSFGSNDHTSIGITAGLNLDFTETIEFGAEAGITHFFCRSFNNFPVPTSNCQSGIYPFMTDVSIQPGNNAFFGAKMSAYHFMGCLSFYFEYIMVRHEKDCIKLCKPDCAFMPELLERRSDWTSQFGNFGFNYDVSPYITIGLLWQAPFSQRAAYKSSTVLVTFNASY